MADKLTQAQFIEKSKEKFGSDYDYSMAVYKSSRDQIILRCTLCNTVFKINAGTHLKSLAGGCKPCGIKKALRSNDQRKYTQEEIVKKFIEIHGNEHYDYSKVKYESYGKKVLIHCNKHNLDFWQSPSTHLRPSGCIKCGNENRGNKIS